MLGKYRLGVDAGGTFTDFVLADRDGTVHLFKSPSTPEDGTRAIADGLAQMATALNKPIESIIADCDLCINGTTVALNALIELKGVKVGLLCTAGHEDSIEIRLGHKEEGYRYDAAYPPAPQLVPRHLRMPVRGRILSDGTEHAPLNEDDIRQAIEVFKREGVQAVAISFVWAPSNASHEQRARDMIRRAMPDVFVCAGHEVYPQVREYTRSSTTIVNAYLSPIMGRYVQRIDDYFRSLGARGAVRYFQSNGGLAVGETMRERAVNAINSGPASAPQAGLYVAAPFGIDNIITVDMGGTSFDITMAHGGQTNLNRNIDFLRHRIGVPMIHVETLGAGGGSIAHLNTFGMLEVGPRSAGAMPGPACYGKGGTEPTVTDANMALGYLQPDAVLGGSIRLNLDRARQAIQEHVAQPLGLSLERAAYGISTLVNLNMANGIRRISIENGYDPRDFALVCAGGAAGMHITALAEEIGSRTVLVPKLASCLCAFGQVISDVKYHFLASAVMVLDGDADLARLNRLFQEMETRGRELLASDGFTPERIHLSRKVEMRYQGQIHECQVELPPGPMTPEGLASLLHHFHQRHEQLYTYAEPHNLVELVNLEVQAVGEVDKPSLPVWPAGDGDIEAARIDTRDMLFDESGAAVSTPVYDGRKLKSGDGLIGPAVIQEPTTTLVVRPGWNALLHSSGTYLLTRQDA
ncbi:hydantoinase/oxoprolinase family protein [Bordetella avium]|uniref:Hydantoin hydantoinase A n=2 Tax=Bordetella avium TaxID=521 RepID=Q2KTV6_BORA1|nr:hydantoinase/oxoprolinase family protein [Bordetella avium]AZY54012.1 hydantoinase/oxoprolinase family protein [Bordetella avium]RIQ19979.1 hydantoinase/oxoprolinase family protein [Bordetella avium]RIQ34559.1 hydantoinase/oxoprolinase family protein [Bordetella avium]RIQ55739.1 hydantoinase/oxoprolinase family protein [Bordetella avium]RIQ74073.1 hydantoinase/oxoprolinase family protein [Bordetella avium]